MAKTVTSSQEILLNDYKYKLGGKVVMEALSPFPERQSIGDDSYDNKLHLSNWTINDLRGGIGVEEMDEKLDWNKCWWTDCIIKYKNHILPPRLATALTTYTAAAAWVSPAGFTDPSTAWSSEANAYDGNTGTKATCAAIGTSAWGGYLQLDVTKMDCDAIRYYSGNAGHAYITVVDIDTYYEGAWHDLFQGAPVEGSYVTKTLPAQKPVEQVRLRFYNSDPSNTRDAWLNDVDFQLAAASGSFLFATFNDTLYVAYGASLLKMNSGRTAMTLVKHMSAAITALIPSINSGLYVYQGDNTDYWFMSTAEAFTETNVADAYWGWQFDNKLFKCNTSGTVTYSTDPESATPTWTAGGTITDIAADIESFTVGRDAAGDPQSYCATNSILKICDLATPEWVDTEVKLPNHPIGGQGFTYFNGKLYLSYGLAIKEYYAETGFVRDVGLTERDGLPVEYNGEITKLLGDSGLEVMFALVDASVTSGNSKSGLYAWDGGWQCWWADTANNGAMYDVIVSSAESGYAVYWAVGSKVYYIDIPRGIQNPDKISQSYGTAGIFISPWFDAGNAAADKLAKSLNTFAKGVTTTETIALKYRIDHTCGDLDSGWTTMDTLNTTGESGTNEELFASGVGESINAIQFRLDFVTAGSTSKADMQAMVFYYKKRTGGETIWSWVVPIVVDNEGQTSAKEKWENLKAAKDSATDILFSYHPNDASTESYYVSVDSFQGTSETGRRYEGNYQLRLIQT